MTIFYFTSTGNCLHVAKSIGGTLYSIPQLMKTKQLTFQDDVIGLVYPIYAFGMPHIVREFMSQVKWKADYSFAIATYGNTSAGALHSLQQFVSKRGMTFDYMKTLLMVDNFLPGFKMEDEIAGLAQKNTEANLVKIVEDIRGKKKYKPSVTMLEKTITAAGQLGGKVLLNGKSAKKYIVNDKCTQCGICAKVCPTANIEVSNKVVFHESCELCYGCIHHCPQNAIHVKNEKSDKRFRNENVALRDIIAANNQQA